MPPGVPPCCRRDDGQNRKFRLNHFPGFQARFNSPRVWEVMEKYKAIAARYDLTLHQMALAFVHSR